MPDENELNRPNKPQIGKIAPEEITKRSPKEILERMKAAQAELERKEADREKLLLEREQECQKKISALQESQKETEQTLELARKEIAGKKEVSEGYAAGIRELEQIVMQIKGAIQTIHGELAEIQNDPGVAERRLREKQEQERKAQQEQAETEARDLTAKVKEHELALEKLAKNMVSFLVKDAGWAFSLDQLHQFKCASKGGRVAAELAEIEKKVAPLEEERDSVTSKLEEKAQGLLKFGTKELEDRLVVVNKELADLQAQVVALTAKATERIVKFEAMEKPVRAEMRLYAAALGRIKDLLKQEPEGFKIVPVKDSDIIESVDGNLRNYGIYKDFLKQFGFAPAALKSGAVAAPPPPPAAE